MKRLILFLAGMIAGFFCRALSLPIPYMLGGIIVGAGARFTIFPDEHWPVNWRNAGLCVAGYGIGRNFTLETARDAAAQVLGITAATTISLVLSVLLAYWIYRRTFANLISAVMAMLPGGLNQMMLMSEEDGRADPNVVIVGQTLRLFSVVFVVPILVIHLLGAQQIDALAPASPAAGGITWLALIPVGAIGYYLAKKGRVPTPQLLGPIVAAAVFSLLVGQPLEKIPRLFMDIAQLNIGLYIGGMLDQERLFRTREIVSYNLTASLVMIASSVIVADFLSGHYGFSAITAFLAMAPGGIAEMCLVALSVGADVSIVLVYQLARLVAMNALAPFLINRYFDEHYRG